MRWKNSAALAILAAGLVSLCGKVNAAPISWNIVSSASSVSFAIPTQTLTLTSTGSIIPRESASTLTFAYRGFNPSTTASASLAVPWTIGNKQNLSGFFTADTDFATSLKFLSGVSANQIAGIDSGSFPPLPNGSEPGTAAADIATRIWLNGGLLSAGINIDLALRDLLYGFDSGVLPLTLGSFDSDAVSFGTLTEDVAYRGRNAFQAFGPDLLARVGSGSYTSLEASSNNSAGAADGSLVVAATPGGNVATLTMPFSMPITFNLHAGEITFPIKMNLTGTIVGTAVVPEPGTVGMLAVGMAMLTPMAVRRWRKRK